MSAWRLLLDQFRSPLIYVLLGAMMITGPVLKDWQDTVMIGVAVAVNTILGFFQERKADRALSALKKMLEPEAKVRRADKWETILAKDLVVGDLVKLTLGDRVPADGRLIQLDSLSLNEAILTGEVVPVEKKLDDQVFMGTMVASGIGQMRVETTGERTKFGQIAASLAATEKEVTPLQKQIGLLANRLVFVVVVVCVMVLAVGLWQGNNLRQMFPTAVALAVAAIPEGLAVALTVILAIGMQRIFKRKALVRKMLAAETLGSVTTIAVDKTGTITEGKMRVVKAISDDQPMLKTAAALVNDMRDPLEVAMMEWAGSAPKGYKRLDEIPFDPDYKYIATLHPGLLLVSGAPEKLLELCPHASATKLKKEFIAEAKKAHRLVGFAYKEFSGKSISHQDIKDLTWLGFLVYEDPVRMGVKEVVEQFISAGIKVKMITGDYKETAEAVGRQVGINRADIYSRIAPEQKLKLVESWQAEGGVVAMTGDGVNDAPALKKADIGIVVNNASDVAKETADMVLLDNNFATILSAIAGGRMIRDNLKKVILYLLADAFAAIFLVIFALITGSPLPITASMILWINLISDGLPSLALTLEPAGKGIMRRPPEPRTALLNRQMVLTIGVISLVAGLFSFLIFIYFDYSQTAAFVALGLSTLIYVWLIASVKNYWMWAASGAGLVLLLAGTMIL